MAKRRYRGNYKGKMAAIKPYVRFNYKHPDKLGRKNKAKLTKYYRFIKETEKGFRRIKLTGKNARKFARAQKQLNPEFRKIKGQIKETEFKVIFVPKNNPPETTVEFDDKGNAYFQSTYAKQRFIPFEDMEELIFHPKEYIELLLEGVPDNARLTLQTATADLSKYAFTKATIGDYMAKLVGDYEGEGETVGDWMLGLNVTLIENQEPAEPLGPPAPEKAV